MSAAAALRGARSVLVGDLGVLRRAAEQMQVPASRLVPYTGTVSPGRIGVLQAGPRLSVADARPGRPSRAAGAAQLAYLEAAYALVRAAKGRALVTGPVSKAAIARSGAPGARRFTGHTEWLRDLDGARESVMCFVADQLVTSLVTTHLALSRVPAALTPAKVRVATVELCELLRFLRGGRVRVAVASLNPHAGEDGLWGKEERRAILPGIRAARRALNGSVSLVGPLGAETAFRKAYAGEYDGVVAMYHDQATIPMKLVSFGEAVNVTLGLSIVRSSVDHGTAYDIAGTGRADPAGMRAALRLAARLTGWKRPRRP